MRRILFTVLLMGVYTIGFSQKLDSTTLRETKAICDCLSKADLNKVNTQADFQELLVPCIFSGMGEKVMQQILENPENGEELGKKIGMNLVAMGCEPFLKLSMKIAAARKDNLRRDNVESDVLKEAGVVLSFEERDFIYLKIKLSNQRDYEFLYFNYIPKSDEWIKNPGLLKGKKVAVQWKETEVFLSKIRQFVKIKVLTQLDIL